MSSRLRRASLSAGVRRAGLLVGFLSYPNAFVADLKRFHVIKNLFSTLLFSSDD